jgi:hypothetical protein
MFAEENSMNDQERNDLAAAIAARIRPTISFDIDL